MRGGWLIKGAIAGAAWLVAAVGIAHASSDRRVALVIGNSTYKEAPLRNPVNDARAMANALRGRGFEVIVRENATKQQMESAIADFGEKLNEGATGLFFYAGHGMQVNGRNFLVPVDASLTSEQRIRIETTDVDLVIEQMHAAKARVSMVILDACRNNPFERRYRSIGGGLAQIGAPEGTLIAYATAPGKVAADGDGRNGLYTEELLNALSQPGLKVEEVFKIVRVAVSRRSNGAQTPWEASSLTGDFYFVPSVPGSLQLQGMTAQTLDAVFWESLKDSSDAADLQIYLKRFPNGAFATAARERIATLAATPVAKPPMQQAALSPPTSLISPASGLDGNYRTQFRAPGVSGMAEYEAAVTIQGTRIRGYAQPKTLTESICPVHGSIDPSGVIRQMGFDCKYSSLNFRGRFGIDAATGAVIGETQASSLGSRAVVDVRWTAE
jgi:hypothetical protein